MLKDLLKKVWGGNSSTDTYLYAQVHQEMSQGYLDSGTWTKSIAESGGSEFKAKARYIELRVDHLRRVELATEKHQKLLEREERLRKQEQLKLDEERGRVQQLEQARLYEETAKKRELNSYISSLETQIKQYELDLEHASDNVYLEFFIFCLMFSITFIAAIKFEVEGKMLLFTLCIPVAVSAFWNSEYGNKKQKIKDKINQTEALISESRGKLREMIR